MNCLLPNSDDELSDSDCDGFYVIEYWDDNYDQLNK